MLDTKPYPLSSSDWKEIIAVPEVRDAWGIEDNETPDDFSGMVYAAKFKFGGIYHA